jgi:hypothetical protein
MITKVARQDLDLRPQPLKVSVIWRVQRCPSGNLSIDCPIHQQLSKSQKTGTNLTI